MVQQRQQERGEEQHEYPSEREHESKSGAGSLDPPTLELVDALLSFGDLPRTSPQRDMHSEDFDPWDLA